ncbi:MAG: hypothetical protein ABJC33_06210 [Betaproteobacteria bacterium]
MNRQSKRKDWAESGAMAVKAGAILSVLSFIAVVATHAPGNVEELPAAAASSSAAASTEASGKPYYFPSQYELNAGEPGEPAPTF